MLFFLNMEELGTGNNKRGKWGFFMIGYFKEFIYWAYIDLVVVGRLDISNIAGLVIEIAENNMWEN